MVDRTCDLCNTKGSVNFSICSEYRGKVKKISTKEKLKIALELLDIYDEFDINFETEPTQATKDRVVYLNRLLGR